MDYADYHRAFFTSPPPLPRCPSARLGGVNILVADLAAARAFYTAVLGEPAYVEGEDAVGWRLGEAWLTLLPGRQDQAAPTVSMTIQVASPAEADRLQQACAQAGATSGQARDTIMYEPVRCCPVVDPLGTEIAIVAPRGGPVQATSA
jgi:catechol 2,3-dioxygenase-like lactoylglutathione lyase family enzyme